MKIVIRSALAFVIATSLYGCAQPGPNPDQMIAAAKTVDQQFLDAFNKGDSTAVMATYWNSPDLVIYPPGEMEAKGWPAGKAAFDRMFGGMKGAKLELTESNYRAMGDAVVGFGKWRITMPGPNGTTTEMLGRYTDVIAQRDGKWVYIIDHPSVPLPPPPPPAAAGTATDVPATEQPPGDQPAAEQPATPPSK
jgi:ketosteroid isomerase-like protein